MPSGNLSEEAEEAESLPKKCI